MATVDISFFNADLKQISSNLENVIVINTFPLQTFANKVNGIFPDKLNYVIQNMPFEDLEGIMCCTNNGDRIGYGVIDYNTLSPEDKDTLLELYNLLKG